MKTSTCNQTSLSRLSIANLSDSFQFIKIFIKSFNKIVFLALLSSLLFFSLQMPHEATVDHYSVNDVDSMPIVFRSRSSSDAGCDALASKRPREKSTEQAVSWPEPPLKVVHIHDDGDSEEDNSESSLSLHSVNSSCTFSPDTEHIN